MATHFQILVVRGLALTLLLVTSKALGAESIETNLLHGIDTAGESPLSYNTSGLHPKGSQFTFTEQVLQKEIKFQQDADSPTPVETKTEVSETIRGAEFLSAGSGFAIGLGMVHSSEEFQSTNTQSGNFRETPLLETFKRVEGRAKVSLELSKDFRLGALIRYRYFEADVLGSFFLTPSERTRYSGGLMGAGASAQFNTESASVAVQYLSSVEGKVSILGENKVTSEPGSLSACGHLNVFSNAQLGGCYILTQYSKDELREPTTGPNPANNTQLSPKGVTRESNLFNYSVIAVGIGLKFGSDFQFKLTGFSEKYERITSPTQMPEADAPADSVVDGYRGRASFLMTKAPVYAELGITYAAREHRFATGNNGTVDGLKSTEYAATGTLGVTF